MGQRTEINPETINVTFDDAKGVSIIINKIKILILVCLSENSIYFLPIYD